MKNIRGHTALLTGATGGIGSYIAHALASEGVNLVLSGHLVTSELESLCEQIRATGVRAETIAADLTQAEELEQLCEHVETAVGPIDILVNNAGIEMTASFTEFTRAELEEIVAVNLTAPCVLTRDAVARMSKRGCGHVVFIASLAGKLGTPYNVPYSATKAGLVALTQSLRAEYANTSIDFSAICPGFIAEAGMYARMEDDGARAPLLARPAGPDAVGKAVVTAIRENRPELIVSSIPMRPVFAAAAIAPRTIERFLRRVGTDDVFRHMAEARGRTGTSVG